MHMHTFAAYHYYKCFSNMFVTLIKNVPIAIAREVDFVKR